MKRFRLFLNYFFSQESALLPCVLLFSTIIITAELLYYWGLSPFISFGKVLLGVVVMLLIIVICFAICFFMIKDIYEEVKDIYDSLKYAWERATKDTWTKY